jgi:hypothetical protein
MPTLYDLSREGLEIFDMLSDNLGELTPEIEQRLDKIMLEGPDKIEAAAMVVRSLEANAAACEAEAERLRNRAKAYAGQVDSLKKKMTACLDTAFNGKVKTPLFTVWTQKSPDRVVAELVPGVTPEDIAQEYPALVRVKVELDRDKCVDIFNRPLAEREGLLPETILFEDRKGTRYVRIK